MADYIEEVTAERLAQLTADAERRITARVNEAVQQRDYEKALLAAGRNAGPSMLYLWFETGRLTRDELRSLILDVWQMAEWPVRSLGERTWLRMFKTAGFVSDTDAAAPTTPLTVWRGATQSRGMSWTLDQDRARWFVQRDREWFGFQAVVFEASIPPQAVLGLILASDSRGEREAILNPNMLRGRTRVVDRGDGAERIRDAPSITSRKFR
jgi:hypothetical protein